MCKKKYLKNVIPLLIKSQMDFEIRMCVFRKTQGVFFNERFETFIDAVNKVWSKMNRDGLSSALGPSRPIGFL